MRDLLAIDDRDLARINQPLDSVFAHVATEHSNVFLREIALLIVSSLSYRLDSHSVRLEGDSLEVIPKIPRRQLVFKGHQAKVSSDPRGIDCLKLSLPGSVASIQDLACCCVKH